MRMFSRKTGTVEQILASIRCRNYVDELPYPERLKQYEQWKPGIAQKIRDGVLLSQEKSMQIEQEELYEVIYQTYKRVPIVFAIKLSAIFLVMIVAIQLI
ncbi:hypothetical protein JKP31_21375 [Vibrio vulnificus]|nr:hypothetical protein [Vibrio vulnificus]